MGNFRLSGMALLIAAIVSFPALESAFVDHTLDARSALIRFAIALVLAMGAIAVVESVVANYRAHNILQQRAKADAELLAKAESAMRRRAEDRGASAR